MYNLLPAEEYDENEWAENSNGNYVRRDSSGDVVATVFCKNVCDPWKIIINGDDVGHIVVDETFNMHPEAISRANDILDGADCILAVLKPSVGPVTTSWQTQKKTANGSPTYGRKHEGLGVSVKKAKSGQWFYITYSGADYSQPEGWFGSAEEAMQAFDAQHF